jgi:hypothetical protein
MADSPVVIEDDGPSLGSLYLTPSVIRAGQLAQALLSSSSEGDVLSPEYRSVVDAPLLLPGAALELTDTQRQWLLEEQEREAAEQQERLRVRAMHEQQYLVRREMMGAPMRFVEHPRRSAALSALNHAAVCVNAHVDVVTRGPARSRGQACFYAPSTTSDTVWSYAFPSQDESMAAASARWWRL